MSKKFKLGFMVGRFQMLHKGHESLINEGLELCDRFVVLLGNAEESRTKNNPFTFEERKEMIKMIYGDKVEVYPIISIGIGYVPAWGNYVMNTIKFYCGDYPDFVLRGSDDGRNNWIDNDKYPHLTEHIVSRNIVPFSATQVRQGLLGWYEKRLDLNAPKTMERFLADAQLKSDYGLTREQLILDDYNRLMNMISPKYTRKRLEKYGEILRGIR
jgi:nicotinamide-nucleotide adenylyltransferase